MKKYDVKIEKASSFKKLPAGAYVCRIVAAKVEEKFNQLVVGFDIIEGEYKDFFKNKFDEDNREDKKWKGTIRMYLPKEDGSEGDVFAKRSLGNNMYCVEASNPGYRWEWDENTLKGKLVGVSFRNKEYSFAGKQGWTTEAGKFETVEDVRNGRVKPLKDKPLKNKPAQTPAFSDSGDEELPF